MTDPEPGGPLAKAELVQAGLRVMDGWIQPRAGAAEVGPAVRMDKAGGFEWELDFGSGTKYLLVRDEILLDPLLRRLATLRLAHTGWLDEPGMEELTIDGAWARGGRGQFRWDHPNGESSYSVTFWGDGLRDRDRVTFSPIGADGSSEERTFSVPDDARPTEPPQGDILLTEKLMQIRGEPMPEPVPAEDAEAGSMESEGAT